MHEIDRIDVRMATYRQLCEWFALYTNLGCDSRAEGMCIVFEMNMTAPEADTGRASSRGGVKVSFHVPESHARYNASDPWFDGARSRKALVRPDPIVVLAPGIEYRCASAIDAKQWLFRHSSRSLPVKLSMKLHGLARPNVVQLDVVRTPTCPSRN